MKIVESRSDLGYLCLQHHSRTQIAARHLDQRACIMGARVFERLQGGQDVGEYDEDEAAYGDLIGSHLWENVETRRPTPGWRLGSWPVAGVERDENDASTVAPLGAEVIAGSSDFAPIDANTDRRRRQKAFNEHDEAYQPIRSDRFRVDTRFRQKTFEKPTLNVKFAVDPSSRTTRFEEDELIAWPKFPIGWHGLVTATDEETNQQDVFHPADPRLVLTNLKAADPDCGTRLVETTAKNEVDGNRMTRLHSAFRVVKRQPIFCGNEPEDGLPKWNDKVEIGTLLWNIHASVGEDELVSGLLAAPPLSAGGVGQGLVVGTLSATRGGPIDLGTESDKHRIGIVGDEDPVNQGKISGNAIYRFFSGSGDDLSAPLKHDGAQPFAGGAVTLPATPELLDVSQGGIVPVWFYYDQSVQHTDFCGNRKDGRHRWWAAVPDEEGTYDPPFIDATPKGGDDEEEPPDDDDGFQGLTPPIIPKDPEDEAEDDIVGGGEDDRDGGGGPGPQTPPIPGGGGEDGGTPPDGGTGDEEEGDDAPVDEGPEEGEVATGPESLPGTGGTLTGPPGRGGPGPGGSLRDKPRTGPDEPEDDGEFKGKELKPKKDRLSRPYHDECSINDPTQLLRMWAGGLKMWPSDFEKMRKFFGDIDGFPFRDAPPHGRGDETFLETVRARGMSQLFLRAGHYGDESPNTCQWTGRGEGGGSQAPTHTGNVIRKRQAPIALRLETWAEETPVVMGFRYAQDPGHGRYRNVGTSKGGVAFMPPESSLYEIKKRIEDSDAESQSYVLLTDKVDLNIGGIPDTDSGEVRFGWTLREDQSDENLVLIRGRDLNPARADSILRFDQSDNVLFDLSATNEADPGNGVGVLAIADATTQPTTTPSHGIHAWVNDLDWKIRDDDGDVWVLNSTDDKYRYKSRGSAVQTGDWSLAAFGTGATITSVRGTDMAGSVLITAGSSAGPSPAVTLTFRDGTWGTTPVVLAAISGGSDSIGISNWTTNATSVTFFMDAAATNGATTEITYHVIGC